MKFRCICTTVAALHALFTGRVIVASAAKTRIINGTAVEKSSPLHAMFAMPTKSAGSDEWLGCGASIISPTFALSSAHCFGGGNTPCTGPQHIALWIGDIELMSQGDTTTVVAKKDGRNFRVE